ncbi:universal stress protein [Desulfatirhabdium butyrativorans]|uniref:universal stress protein n=1 Tax=Desulfatirhabdium butyrativorans TaxID=340467 RepID=UPI00040CC3D2|nr:universal stress protein [Desulfatirhabdium butyrativorans]
MFDKIVVATDLSPASDQVLGCLHGLKPLGAREVVLTHALGIRHLEELQCVLAPQVEPGLLQQKSFLEAQGFQVTIQIEPGLPAIEIDQVARKNNASLIVLGSHGATLSREILLGSVATEVLHHSRHPVLVVRPKIDDSGVQVRCEQICTDFFRHILFITDFSETAEHAFAYIEKIVQSGGKHVTMLHVQDRAQIEPHLKDRLEEFNRIDRSRLERMMSRLKELGATEVGIELLYGLPKQEIVRHADKGDYTLIVMGTHGRGFYGNLFMGSIAYHVVRNSALPTLLIPPIR